MCLWGWAARPGGGARCPGNCETSRRPADVLTCTLVLCSPVVLPQFNIVSPGADLDIYFPYQEVGGWYHRAWASGCRGTSLHAWLCIRPPARPPA